jgi:hypothetical protein
LILRVAMSVSVIGVGCPRDGDMERPGFAFLSAV